MYFLTHDCSLALADDDFDVTGPLEDPRAATFCTCTESFQRRTLVDHDLGDAQTIDVRTLVVFRVRDRRLDDLANDRGTLLGRELQRLQCLGDILATHLVGDQTRLLWRDPGKPV